MNTEAMDLRTLPEGLSPDERITLRRKRVEDELKIDLNLLEPSAQTIGMADEKNCEQMIGSVPIPVGMAGPLSIRFSSEDETIVHLPLATTEGALVASVNRGCKAVSTNGVRTSCIQHGITRSIAFHTSDEQAFTQELRDTEQDWKNAAEATSHHLKILSYTLDARDHHVFLTIAADTGEAMGMNMVTIAAEAAGNWIMDHTKTDAVFITVAGNVDSDKKPSRRTYEKGRGYEVHADALLSKDTIESILKSTPEQMLQVAEAKLKIGSEVAGAIGANLHAANIIAALYLATGQDAAHVVEGSLTDTRIAKEGDGLRVHVRLPAILVGIRGGGTNLPAQNTCLNLLLQPKTSLTKKQQLAETIGAAVLAGEISLLAAQAAHQLAKAHRELGR